jgi:hypothetical protein
VGWWFGAEINFVFAGLFDSDLVVGETGGGQADE